ncbi:hypothetical protein [Streptomyces sp. SA15]|uniref:hypothetical protein n=1 Tax=Streptomyces sp. SA15 TaxID=934019 RepID=UPI00211C9451|nr:hypothetical protein [Streptomyces sp. SA15]
MAGTVRTSGIRREVFDRRAGEGRAGVGRVLPRVVFGPGGRGGALSARRARRRRRVVFFGRRTRATVPSMVVRMVRVPVARSVMV